MGYRETKGHRVPQDQVAEKVQRASKEGMVHPEQMDLRGYRYEMKGRAVC